jgi:hypothetical protein
MDLIRLQVLNRRLRDYLGTNPAGEGLYKWVHSRDLRIALSRCGNRIFESVPMVDSDRWVLAMWSRPPARESWDQFENHCAYPSEGYWVPVDTPADWILERGEEPTERMTMYIIGLRKKELNMGPRGIMRNFQKARERTRVEQDNTIDDILTNSWTAFGNVPGSKESVSFPTVPSLRT